MDLNRRFLKQKAMRRVLISLAPITLFAIFLYGWHVLAMMALVSAVAIAVEYTAMRLISGKDAKVSEAVLVTSVLFTLTLPPSTPWWVAVIGIAFGVFFGKGVFGGFGRNIFNPALVSRCFVYIAFPAWMTNDWRVPFTELPGGFARFVSDTVAGATPMALLKSSGDATGLLQLFWGFIAGSVGETSALLILIGALYLLITKTASWQIMLSGTVTFAAVSGILYLTGSSNADPLTALLSGGVLFALVFMATDPVSAPSQPSAKVFYAILIAAACALIRTYALFTEGIMFAVLFANVFSPLLDRQVKAWKSRKKAVA